MHIEIIYVEIMSLLYRHIPEQVGKERKGSRGRVGGCIGKWQRWTVRVATQPPYVRPGWRVATQRSHPKGSHSPIDPTDRARWTAGRLASRAGGQANGQTAR